MTSFRWPSEGLVRLSIETIFWCDSDALGAESGAELCVKPDSGLGTHDRFIVSVPSRLTIPTVTVTIENS